VQIGYLIAENLKDRKTL